MLLCSIVPTAPHMLTVTGTPTGSTVELNWLPPLHPNGAIRYEIEYEPAVPPGDTVTAGNSNTPFFTLTLPDGVNSRGRAKSGHLVVNWLPPLHPNGAIRYEIEYEPAMTHGDLVSAGSSSSPFFTLTLPNGVLSYTVRVGAVNSRG